MLKISPENIDDRLADKQLYSLKVLKTPHLSIYLARVLIVLTVLTIMALFMPWQQNIRGGGKVTALNPANRPQTVQSIIPGRILNWHVQEGQFVTAGDTILELAETKDKYFDPEILLRMSEQIEAKKSGLLAKNLKKGAYQNQIIALKESLQAKLKQAENKIDQTEFKVNTDSAGVEAERINYMNYKNIFERNKMRYESGNIALTKFQEMESKFNAAKAKLVEKENKYLQTISELIMARTNLSVIQAEFAEKISKATSELQSTLSDINDSQGELAKYQNEYKNVEVRRDNYIVIARLSGYVVKVLMAGIGENIKEGEAIATIQLENPDLAVEMFVRAMDIPLISKDRKVRVQFDGWPALQFSGWPSVSVGTFGGLVRVIDRVNNSNGTFRILVTPDPDDETWPNQLRLGSGIKGWVMLDNVSVGYEIWRQFNGFPASLYGEPSEEQGYDKDKSKDKSKDK